MTEIIKVNLDRTYLFLKITGIVAGALIAIFVAYNQLDQRMDSYETQSKVNDAKDEFRDKQIEDVGEKLDKILEYIVNSKSDNKHAKGDL